MACFVVPLGEAVITTVVQKVVKKNEGKSVEKAKVKPGISWSKKLSWLNQMLWGGSILLALEHVWHGEVVPWPPFLTAMRNPSSIGPMVHEILTVGVAMAVTVTVVWAVIVMIAERKAKAVPEVKGSPANGG